MKIYLHFTIHADHARVQRLQDIKRLHYLHGHPLLRCPLPALPSLTRTPRSHARSYRRRSLFRSPRRNRGGLQVAHPFTSCPFHYDRHNRTPNPDRFRLLVNDIPQRSIQARWTRSSLCPAQMARQAKRALGAVSPTAHCTRRVDDPREQSPSCFPA
jgi:hypothetical protein